MKLKLGSTVHYVDDTGRSLAAIVVCINAASPMNVNLTVFGERGGQVLGYNSVPYSVDLGREGTWHWPE